MTAVPHDRRRLTVAEYLAGEATAEFKSEYWNGETFAMAGSSPEHAGITANFCGETRQRLKGKACRTWSPDLRVKSGAGLYTYPDLAIVCGPPQYEQLPGQGVKTLVNPAVLAEVLSESTEARDRGFKFAQYSALPSLQQYVLVHQDQARVEVFTRQASDEWLMKIYVGLDCEVALDSVEVRIPMAEIYRDIELPPAPLDPAT